MDACHLYLEMLHFHTQTPMNTPGKRVSPGAPSFSASYYNSHRALLYTAVELDPGDPLIYCSSTQEREGERKRAVRGGQVGVVGAGEGKEWDTTEVEGEGGETARCCRCSPICSSIFLACFLLDSFAYLKRIKEQIASSRNGKMGAGYWLKRVRFQLNDRLVPSPTVTVRTFLLQSHSTSQVQV